MRFVVYGAGGIGGVLGGLLHRSGHSVVLIARGAHYEAVARDGLRLETPTSAETLAVPVVDHPARLELGDDDVVLLAMKSHDTVAALAALPPGIPIVCVQNGVANEREALRRFADVYGVCVMCPTNFLSPGVVQAYSSPTPGILDLGRYPSGVDALETAVSGAFRAAGFESEPRPDIMRWKYGKLLMNLGNAIEALCGPRARAGTLASLTRSEGEAVLQAAGIDFVSDDEDAARRGDLLSMHPIAGERRGGGSTWQSLQRGTGSIETDYLNGEIVLLGRLHGVPTPVNALLQRLANRAARDAWPPGSMTEEDVLAQRADCSARTSSGLGHRRHPRTRD